MQTCPHCGNRIIIKELPYPGLFKNYRVCPDCSNKFTVDRATKYRQALCIGIALVSLVLTALLYYDYTRLWLISALTSYVVLAAMIFWGNRQVYFVPYPDTTSAGDDT